MKIFILILFVMISCNPEIETRTALLYKAKSESRWVVLEPGDILIFGLDTFLVRETSQEATPYKFRSPNQRIKF